MSTASRSRVVDSQLARFGELVTLPGGATVSGIFDPAPQDVGARWRDERGAPSMGFQQPGPPTLWIEPSDANGLAVHDRLLIGSRAYLISRIDGTDPYLTRFTLRVSD